VRPSHGHGKIFLVLIVALLPLTASARGKRSATYDGSIDFAAQLLQLDDGCLSVDGEITSGTFFADLKRIDLGSRPEYRKGNRVVTEYPESLTTSVRVAGDQCAHSISSWPSSIFGGNSYSLAFEVEWKDGMQMRPAAMSAATIHCVGSRAFINPSMDVTVPSVTCQLKVESKGVPLADHLIVSIFSADGRRLTRLSAAP
jgi:hypothetical protein